MELQLVGLPEGLEASQELAGKPDGHRSHREQITGWLGSAPLRRIDRQDRRAPS